MLIVRQHVLAGRSFDSITDMDAAFAAWLPIRRAQTHRTHGQVISVRAAADRAALAPLPDYPYVVAERFLRRVGRDCLISFEASFYSVPARHVRAGQSVEVRAEHDTITIHAIGGGPQLATHTRAGCRGSWVVDPERWAGLPDGHSRATVIDLPARATSLACDADPNDTDTDTDTDAVVAARQPGRDKPGRDKPGRDKPGRDKPGRDVVVAVRPLADYAAAAGLTAGAATAVAR